MKTGIRCLTGVACVALASLTALPTATAQNVADDTVTAQDTDVDINIVGGRQSTQVYPWMVSVGGCGGSLVHPKWVVTAAHCINGRLSSVRMNTLTKNSGGVTAQVSRTIKHPGYRGNADRGRDIALVELAQPVSGVATVPIAAAVGPVGTETRIIGWGATTPSGDRPATRLKELDTSVVAANRCDGVAGKFFADHEICTDNPGGNQGACFGDSGGPQVKQVNGRWELIGATSRGERTCAQNASIYTSVPAHIDWLTKTSGGDITRGDGNTPNPGQPNDPPAPDPAPDRPDTDRPDNGRPGWPGPGRPGQPGRPGWPGGDRPNWPGNPPGGWPGNPPGGWPGGDRPGWPGGGWPGGNRPGWPGGGWPGGPAFPDTGRP